MPGTSGRCQKEKKSAGTGSHQKNQLQFASFVYQMSCPRTRFPALLQMHRARLNSCVVAHWGNRKNPESAVKLLWSPLKYQSMKQLFICRFMFWYFTTAWKGFVRSTVRRPHLGLLSMRLLNSASTTVNVVASRTETDTHFLFSFFFLMNRFYLFRTVWGLQEYFLDNVENSPISPLPCTQFS